MFFAYVCKKRKGKEAVGLLGGGNGEVEADDREKAKVLNSYLQFLHLLFPTKGKSNQTVALMEYCGQHDCPGGGKGTPTAVTLTVLFKPPTLAARPHPKPHTPGLHSLDSRPCSLFRVVPAKQQVQICPSEQLAPTLGWLVPSYASANS